MILNTDTSNGLKQAGSIFVFITGITIGWYFNFIPTILFAMMIFIITIVGAVLWFRIFGKASEGGI